ncbi:hypothetical protein AAY473_008901 [Plecturocebus cupreus]
MQHPPCGPGNCLSLKEKKNYGGLRGCVLGREGRPTLPSQPPLCLRVVQLSARPALSKALQRGRSRAIPKEGSSEGAK